MKVKVPLPEVATPLPHYLEKPKNRQRQEGKIIIFLSFKKNLLQNKRILELKCK